LAGFDTELKLVGDFFISMSNNKFFFYFPFGASGNRLEKLSKNQFSIRLSKQYRLLFKWDKKKQFAYDIEINPHNKRYGK
jgi:plasmid maintenance system killer protein